MNMFVPTLLFFLITLLSTSTSSEAAVQDFCVGNPAAPEGPAGYSCDKASHVTVNDFIFPNFLKKPVVFSPIYKAGLTTASYPQFPAVNGLGISAVYVEIYLDGVVPLHTHPRGTEILIVIDGTITAGFISTDNKVYYKILNTGDLIVFPQGLLHFQMNAGRRTAKLITSYSSSDAGLQLFPSAIFGNNLPSSLVANVSFVDYDVVKKRKAMFGGTN